MAYEQFIPQPVSPATLQGRPRRPLAEQAGQPWRRPWLRVFGVGMVLWVASTVDTVWTGNGNLLPTVILLGSFLVPVTFVVWAWERRTQLLTTDLLFRCFVVGGVLGVLGAATLESYLLRPGWFVFLAVGFIEEFVKLAALIWCARTLHSRTVRDGAILGATVGFGFAALESAGYAFNAFFTSTGLSLQRLVETEVLRGVLTPFGHGLWTGIVGAVLFAAAPRGRLRITGRVLLGYVAVSLLHGLWDSMNGIAIVLTVLLTGQQWQIVTLESGRVPQITPEQANVFTMLSDGGLALVSLLGLLVLWYVLRSDRLHPPDALSPRAVRRAGGYPAAV
jgi:RsiW-degrading membrane proteinase PrsW (M82 family)